MLVGELAPGAGIAAIRRMLAGVSLAFDPQAMRATLSRAGAPTLALDYAGGLAVDGAPFAFPDLSIEPLVREIDAPLLA